MAKTKNRTRSETDHLRGIIRDFEKEIRSLRQQLRQYEKYDRNQDVEYSKDSEDTNVMDTKLKVLCSSCGKNYMVETLNLGIRGVFGECICGYRGKIG